MSVLEEKLCRLCLTMVTNESDIIDEVTREMFDVFLLKLNFEVSENPIICQECLEIAVKFLDFKSVCVDTEEIIRSYAVGSKKCKFKIRDMYEDNIDVKCEIGEECIICRFCMNPTNTSQAIPFDSLMNETLFKKALLRHMPEVDFNIVQDTMVCTTCLDNLLRYFEYVHKCSEVEKKINGYFQENGNNDGGYVKLSDVLCCTVKGELACSTKCPQTFTIKREANTNIFESENSKPSEINAELVKLEELDIKDIHCRSPEIELDQCYDRYSSKKNCKETKFNTVALKTQKVTAKKYSEIQKKVRTKCTSESKQKKYAKNANKLTVKQIDSVNRANDESKIKIFACKLCTFKTHHSGSLNNHRVVHKDISKIEIYHCSQCTYKSKYKCAIKRHMLVHTDISESKIYNCSECSFISKYKTSLDVHMLIHKDFSEIKIYKCPQCAFKSRYKAQLKRHVLVHRDISETEMFHCSECTFKSKCKVYLKRHVFVHKDISTIEMFSCSQCTFKARQKCELKRHVLVHKDISETEMYHCSECTFKSKYKGYLKQHVLVHRNISEIETFNCSKCTFKSKYKRCLKDHMLVHRDISEIETFNCSKCTYKSKFKCCLQQHILVHGDTAEGEMFNCSECRYKSMYKGYLKRHVSVHRDISEKETFNCSECTFKSKRKYVLNRHMLIHKDFSEIKMYKCSECSFTSKYRTSLNSHKLIHI